MNSLFQFRSKTDEDIKDAERMIDMTGDLARQCLDTEIFKRYQNEFARTEQYLINALITYSKSFVESDKGDVTKYAMTVNRYLTKLETVRALLSSVKSDAKRGVVSNEV